MFYKLFQRKHFEDCFLRLSAHKSGTPLPYIQELDINKKYILCNKSFLLSYQ